MWPSLALGLIVVQSLSCVWFLRPQELQHVRLSGPSLSPRVCSNSCPSSWWCHPTILSSVTTFSSCLQSFVESFPMSRLFASGAPKYWSFSIIPSNEYSGFISFRIDGFDLLAVQGTLLYDKDIKMNISLTVESSEWFCLLLPFFIPTPLILMHLYYSLLFLSGEKYMHPKVSNHGTFFPMSQAWVDHSWPLGNEWKPVIGSQIRKGPASTLSISFLKMEKSGENDRLISSTLLLGCDPGCFMMYGLCMR